MLDPKERFVDLFTGSASVSHFVAESSAVPVWSVDLQHYSKVLSESVITRTEPISDRQVVTDWVKSTLEAINGDEHYRQLAEPIHRLGRTTVLRSRKKSAAAPQNFFITAQYGGHYFSSQQAYFLDSLYQTLPEEKSERAVGLAALLRTASSCAAAPGHTAQPFQPTPQLLPFIKTAWSKDVGLEVQREVEYLSGRSAKRRGAAFVADATGFASQLNSGDLVFCDPPYSDAQYSRFYHVLEGISQGGWSDVGGAGRAPQRSERASSAFSMRSQSNSAITALLAALRSAGCTVMITFPDASASNGLSGREIVEIASREWLVEVDLVDSIHSTMGGSKQAGGRGGRRRLQEAVLCLQPR